MKGEMIHLDDLASWLNGKADWILYSISYEARSPIVRRNANQPNIRNMGFYHENHDYNNDALTSANAEAPDAILVPLNSDAPLISLDRIRTAVGENLSMRSPLNVIVDITCFTRETLAMLIMVLHHMLPQGSKIRCVYNKAEKYADPLKDGDLHNWLSRGIVDIRSVLGYRGRVSLVAKTHLIVIPGFEAERAQAIIEELQPDRLTIGKPSTDESFRPEFALLVEEIIERLKGYYPEKSIAHFTFSSRDPFRTEESLLKCLRAGENTIVACLNTKVTMMGVILAALSNRDIQLVYAQPAHYNLSCLSDPSEDLLVFDLPL